MPSGFQGTPRPDPSGPVDPSRTAGSADGDAHAFGRYQLFAKLGSGGQADVYLAIARGTLGVDKLVVIKRARPGLTADPAALADFLDEARFTLRLNHPNLVHTYEVGQEQGAHFISMEHVEGLSLKELFGSARTRTFAPAIWLRVIADALSGLSHAHSLRDYDGKPLGIVHRDISPHNLVVSYDGVTKVLDFGIAKAALSGAATEIGSLTGKAAYMAPEQALGTADRRSDLFAMGVVLWEMLSGQRMFRGEPVAILQRLARDPIPRLSSVVPDIDEELDELVARALEKDPHARYQSANEMRQTLERYLRKTGQVVRELEVGEAISTAFHDERARLAARIQQAMAGVATAPTSAELPRLPGQSGELRTEGPIEGPVEGPVESPVESPVDGPADAPAAGPTPGALEPASARAASGALAAPVLAGNGAVGAGATLAPPGPDVAREAERARLQPMAGAAPPYRPRWWSRPLLLGGAVVAIAVLAWVSQVRGVGAPASGVAPRAGGGPPRLAREPAGAATACATPIRVRVMYDMTGTTKEVGTAAGKGEVDYLRALAAAGGIRGCKLELDVQDTRYDKHASLEVYSAWKARPEWPEVSTIFVQGTPMTQVLGPLAAEDHKVVLSGAYAGELATPVPTTVDVAVPSLSGAFAEASVQIRKQSIGYPYVFFQGTDYTTAARVAANFAWRQGAKRMAFFYCSTSSFCTDPVDGAKTFLKLLGGTKIGRDLFLELGDDARTTERKVLEFFRQERLYKSTHPDYEPVDWIWFGNTSTNSAGLGKAIAKARSQLGVEVQVIGNNWSVDESLYRRCGEPCVGFNVVQPFALFGDLTAAGTAALLADYATYRALDGEPVDAYRTVQYVYGRVAVATWRIAVERLLDQGRPVTGANLRAVLEDFRRVDVEGFASIGYSATDHRPQSGARVARLGAHGELEMIGQPLSLSLQDGWLGW